MDANLISVYTRAQALEDGVLVDVSEMAREAGFGVPTAITQRLHETLNHITTPAQDYKGRLWDVLWMCRMACRGATGDTVYFKVKIGNRVHDLWAKIGPGDHMEPVLTVMFTDED